MKIIFLGTSGSMPTPERNSSAIAIKRKNEIFLMDCGEGTQRQMVKGHVGFRRPTRILISHLHGDHVLGLPGLLQTMSLLRREKKLEIYGPKGVVDFVKSFSETFGGPTFPVVIFEIIEKGVIEEHDEYVIIATPSDHEIPGWSYALIERPRPGRFHPEKARELGVPEGRLWGRLQQGEDVQLENGFIIRSSMVVDPPRAGRSVIFSGDTKPTKRLIEIAKGADLMIHEATFDDSLIERAEEDGHSTASQAAEVAAKAGVKELILTHISSRYPDPSLLLDQAKEIFPNTKIAFDLMVIDLPLSD